MQPAALQRTGFANAAAVGKLMDKAQAGAALGEREEMAVATVASLQLLNHFFVEQFKITGWGANDVQRTAVAQ